MGMVTTIPEGGLDYMLYGDKSHVISNYLERQMQAMPAAFNAFTTRIYDAMAASYNYVNDSLTKMGILNRMQANGIQAVDNYFRVLTTYEDFQNADATMQRWVMSHPATRELYLQQNIDGYSDTYTNVFGKEVGEKDYNYRRVMSGMLVDMEDHSKVVHYHDTLFPGDRELSFQEKMVALATWRAQDLLLHESDIDFTCRSDQPVKINRE